MEIATSTGCPQQRPDNFSFSKPATESIAWWRKHGDTTGKTGVCNQNMYIMYIYNIMCLECICDISLYIYYNNILQHIYIYGLKIFEEMHAKEREQIINKHHAVTSNHTISSHQLHMAMFQFPMRNDQRLIQSNPYSQPLS